MRLQYARGDSLQFQEGEDNAASAVGHGYEKEDVCCLRIINGPVESCCYS
ncbi:MAG: hypothetical protein ACK4VP_08200 [Nitrospira sp.]